MNDEINPTEAVSVTPKKRNIWMRGLFMVLTMLAVHVCGTVLFIVTAIQFIMMLLNETPNPRLTTFGRSLGGYLQQGANFLTFATEDIPFPFSDWPSGN
jgi:hypothetical protein